MGHILQLYQLQSLDSEIDQIEKQLADIKARLGESDALKQARAAVESLQQQLRQAQTKMQDLDLEVKGISQKAAQQEKLLYSGKVLSAKEAANLQEEVASLNRRRTELEERLLEAMVAVEEKEAALAEAESQLAAVEAGWQANQADLLAEQQALTTKLADLRTRRPEVTQQLAPAELKTYESLRPKKAGRAVALVKSGVCQGCGVEPSNSKLRQARAGTELVFCNACGRILYVP